VFIVIAFCAILVGMFCAYLMSKNQFKEEERNNSPDSEWLLTALSLSLQVF